MEHVVYLCTVLRLMCSNLGPTPRHNKKNVKNGFYCCFVQKALSMDSCRGNALAKNRFNFLPYRQRLCKQRIYQSLFVKYAKFPFDKNWFKTLVYCQNGLFRDIVICLILILLLLLFIISTSENPWQCYWIQIQLHMLVTSLINFHC